MPKTDNVPVEWMQSEKDRSKSQAAGQGSLVNVAVPTPKEKKAKAKAVPAAVNKQMPFVERIQKGFHPTKDKAGRFDVLVARQKHASGKKGPDLIDEALDLLFQKYDA